MNTSNTEQNIGTVTPKTQRFDQPLVLDSGITLKNYEICYETYGTLNQNKTNAILICHALSSDHHAAGYHDSKDKKPGWWDNCIGPGKPVDTDKFFVVCSNNLGGCGGSTGPMSRNPLSTRSYGPDFPIVTVRDWVESQARLADKLEIDCWAAVMGGSLGGMQALQWSIDYPKRVQHAIVIAAAPKLSTQNIAFNEISRQAIMADKNFHEGRYTEHNTVPSHGLKLARMIGHVTYLSDDGLHARFGRERLENNTGFGFNVEFEIESYLRYQAESFVERFDANTYLLMTRSLDYFDPAQTNNNNLKLTLTKSRAKFLVISFSSDWRFAPSRSQEIVRALTDCERDVTYAEIKSEFGHDSFLLPIPDYHSLLHAYLEKV
jgi:homoserine O-acetyltransferase